jgi:hypothetical protein
MMFAVVPHVRQQDRKRLTTMSATGQVMELDVVGLRSPIDHDP